MEAEHMTDPASPRTSDGRRTSSLVGLVRLLARLTPRQFSDEFSLARAQLKDKGIRAGIAAGFLVAALLLLAAFAVALITAAIMGLAAVMDAWLAALLVALVFLVLAAIAAMLGISRFRKAMPLLPEDAIRGVRHDIGVLREGRRFDPATLEARRRADKAQKEAEEKAEKREKARRGEADAVSRPAPSYEELRSRSGIRRSHLADARDGLGRRLDFKARWQRMTGKRGTGSGASAIVPPPGPGPKPAAGTAVAVPVPVGGTPGAGHSVTAADRWKPLTVIAASAAAIAVMVRKLIVR
jgi:hypothetical protein